MGGGQRRQTQAGGLQAGAQRAAAGRGETQATEACLRPKLLKVSRNIWILVNCIPPPSPSVQRLAGATLLVFANKQDLPGALSKDAIQEVATTEQFPWYSQVT